MERMILVIDESGAKGYSDKRESYPGEVGVMAGFLIPDKHLKEVVNNLETIRQQYPIDGKSHITDLDPTQQENLRNDIFNYFLKNRIPCIYEAIHVEGFFQQFQFTSSLIKKPKDQRRSKIKISGNERKELLHKQLFQGAFAKAIAFCMDFIGDKFLVSVITDEIDKGVEKKFNDAACELINFGKESIQEVTGYDPDKNKVVRGKIETKIDNAKEVIGDFSGVKFSIDVEDSALTLASDVIANSINYHFKQRTEDGTDIGAHLNTKNAILGHPLEALFYGLWDNSEINYFSDAIFMHPQQKDIKIT